MGKIKKKFESGASTNYISRKQALRKLQLSLKDFRRLCILKGIYPHEPKHKKKVNKGSTEIKTWYYVKDIYFLANEPIIQKFRDYRVFLRRLKKAKEKCESDAVERLLSNKPKYKLSHIVKERYPNFPDAIRDLDDALCLCSLFARMPKSSVVKQEVIHSCRRLTVEFMHYVVAAKCLRKVFVSVKGVYYQADIMGEKVTWVVPHERMQPPVTDVDFSIMATFLEFYIAMLGSVNCHLFGKLGLHYPPKLASVAEEEKSDSESLDEIVYSLAQPLQRASDSNIEDDIALDSFPIQDESEEYEELRLEQERTKSMQQLFKGHCIFLNREVPRESLVFVIRSCGGEVSWDSSLYYGSTFEEDDERISYQIVDRPSISNVRISRFYVQPQWVYDCVNVGKLLPAEEYFLGCDLPPHLSPFVQEQPGDYVPPERIQQLVQAGQDVSGLERGEEQAVKESAAPKKKRKLISQNQEGGGMVVEAGSVYRPNKQKTLNEQGEHQKLREMMIAKKHKRVYHKMKRGAKRKARQVREMQEKRKSIEG